jgi:hypothetical protein
VRSFFAAGLPPVGKETIYELERRWKGWNEAMKQCEYFLVQYVPALTADLRLSVGLFLFEKTDRLVRFGRTQRWRRVRCLDPRADVEILDATFNHFQALAADTLSASVLREELVRLCECGVGTLQVASPRAVETNDPEREFDRLFREHIEAPRAGSSPRASARPGSRRWIRRQIGAALDQRGLLDRVQQDVNVAEFTVPGDAFRIDFACLPRGAPFYFHALSLESDWNQAKVLSYTFERIRQRQAATLTAIVAGGSHELPAAENCGQILQDAGIALQQLSTVDSFVERLAKML